MNQIIKSICLYVIMFTVVVSNLVNYFYAYKHLQDRVLQWKIAMFAIAIVLFLFSLYVFFTEKSKHNNTIKVVISGWLAIYLLINLIGVCLGYTLHTKGFMAMLFVVSLLSVSHIIRKVWQNYF